MKCIINKVFQTINMQGFITQEEFNQAAAPSLVSHVVDDLKDLKEQDVQMESEFFNSAGSIPRLIC
jgi:hypothetical protein